MAVLRFEESRVSDTVYEFRAFLISGNPLIESLCYWLPCLFLVAGAILLSSTILSIIIGFIFICAIWSFYSQVTEESVLIIKDFGIQLRIKYRSGGEETKFLDKDKITGLIVHECIVGSSVRYELAFLMRGESKLSLSFKHLYPGLNDLTRVYKACVK
mmetsp:Transcript_1520/g.1661  ORF Transcript_1520/g.1661 Transcript_1520/m.1661 type:complete len:158 (+) Transcript_1520:419-892(+)